MTDHFRVVVMHHRFSPGNAGQDKLCAPTEARKEVRLDEAGEYANRGVEVMRVDPHWAAKGCLSKETQLGGIR